MIKITDYAHRLFEEYDLHDKTVVDMTAGNGLDTVFLASKAKKVYAFDIQSRAINATKQQLEDNKLQNVTLIQDNHINLDVHIHEPIFGGIYNLGYLPGGDRQIMTTAETTITSVKKLLKILEPNGIVVIVCYEKHNPDESLLLHEFLGSLPGKIYDVMEHVLVNKKLSPYVIQIHKIG
jgi:tRNA G37 N-methylase Trm5